MRALLYAIRGLWYTMAALAMIVLILVVAAIQCVVESGRESQI